MGDETLQSVDKIPLDSLSISRILKRELQGIGVHDLSQAFALDDRTIVTSLSDKSDRELTGYRRQFEKDPDALREKLVQAAEPHQGVSRTISTAQTASRYASVVELAASGSSSDGHANKREDVSESGVHATRVRPRTTSPSSLVLLPAQPFSEVLKEFETQAIREFGTLLSHAHEAIVAETFPAFELQIDKYRESWREYFRFYATRSMHIRALEIVEKVLPHSFVIAVADAARRLHEGRTLLEYIFGEFSIDTQFAQRRFKELFVNIVSSYGMQTYSASEAVFYYQHTIILHAGLSDQAWKSLWEDTLIPIAKHGDVRQANSGYDVLHRALEEGGTYQVGHSGIRHMLAKAPADTIAPLLEASLKVARQYERYNKRSTDVALLSSEGLSGEAMQAYLQVIQKLEGPKPHSGSRTDGARSARGARRAFYWLNDPLLFLDLRRSERPVCVKIRGQRLSSDFEGRVFEVYVNGELVLTEPVKRSLYGCLVESRSEWVEAAEHYAVEVKIIEETRRKQRVEVASRITHFVDAREGVFEFIGRPGDDVLQYEGVQHRHTGVVRKAYLVSPGYRVERGTSTMVVGTVTLEGGFSTFAYETGPGGSATVFAPDGRQVAWLQEQYSATVDRTWLMGSLGGRDLFGQSHLANEPGYNHYLPSIEIVAPEVSDARDELTVSCTCDGGPYYPRISSVGIRAFEDGQFDDGRGGSRAIIDLALTLTPLAVEDGRVIVKHRTTGETILDYRFSVVPIRSFRIESIGWRDEAFAAKYSFKCCCSAFLVDPMTKERVLVNEGNRASFTAPLSSENETIEISFDSTDGAKTMSPRFMLAGMSVEMPECWQNSSHVISYDDVSAEDGSIRVVMRGNRSWGAVKRGFYLQLGEPLCIVPDILSSLKYNMDVFVPLLAGSVSISRLGDEPEIKMLELLVSYGWPKVIGEDPKPCDVPLGQLRCGFDNKLSLATHEDGRPYLEFGQEPRSELYYRFSDRGEGELLEGDSPIIELPKRSELRNRRDPLTLRLAACGPLDFEPNWNLVQKIRI